ARPHRPGPPARTRRAGAGPGARGRGRRHRRPVQAQAVTAAPGAVPPENGRDYARDTSRLALRVGALQRVASRRRATENTGGRNRPNAGTPTIQVNTATPVATRTSRPAPAVDTG